MRRWVLTLATAGLALASLVSAEPPAWDFEAPRYEIVQKTYDVPEVADKTPYSPGAAFMSREGYLRYTTYEKSGQWLTPTEAAAAVRDQEEAANR